MREALVDSFEGGQDGQSNPFVVKTVWLLCIVAL
jgi:hypothetical protein